jgi:hypothetical protein
MTATHPRRYYVERDNSTGRWDVFDAYKREYVAVNLCHSRAESLCNHMKVHQWESK